MDPGFEKPNDWVFRPVSPCPCSSWLYPDAKFGEDDGITDFYTTSTLQPKRMTSNISTDFCIYAIDLHIPIDSLGWSCRMKHQFNVVARCRKALSTLIRFVLVGLLGLRSRWSVHTDAYLGICDKYIYIIYTIIQLYTWMIHIHPSMDYLWISGSTNNRCSAVFCFGEKFHGNLWSQRPEPMPCGLCVELLFLDEEKSVNWEATSYCKIFGVSFRWVGCRYVRYVLDYFALWDFQLHMLARLRQKSINGMGSEGIWGWLMRQPSTGYSWVWRRAAARDPSEHFFSGIGISMS